LRTLGCTNNKNGRDMHEFEPAPGWPARLAALRDKALPYAGWMMMIGLLFAIGFGIQYNKRHQALDNLEHSNAIRGTVTALIGQKCAWNRSFGSEYMNNLMAGRTFDVGVGQVCLAVDLYLKPNEPIPMQLVAVKEIAGDLQAGDHVYIVQAQLDRNHPTYRYGYTIVNARDKGRVLAPQRESLLFCIAGALLALCGALLQAGAALKARAARNLSGPAA
jgi:hypothetical protein